MSGSNLMICLGLLSTLAPMAVADDAVLLTRLDAGVERGVGFLIRHQQDDGAWRSAQYGVLKEGPELTPWICLALADSRGLDGERRQAISRANRYLARLIDADGNVQTGPWGLNYPVYTAAAASRAAVVKADDPRTAQLRKHWLDYLRSYQLREPLGWRPDDASYGGWAFGAVRLKRPDPLPMEFPGANLSVTLIALEALRAGGMKIDDPRLSPIRDFVLRCQNLPAAGQPADPDFDDGGFFFSPDDWIRNKAGSGQDRFGRRFYSYGSCTADGLRALLLCGLPPTDRRVMAAHRWLLENFDATEHPGRFTEDRKPQKEAYYFYYAQSAAQALAACSQTLEANSSESSSWAGSLATELLRRQNEDGRWQSNYTEGKEDDPLLTTHLALTALATCRRQLETGSEQR